MEVIKNEYTKLMDGIKYVVAPRGCESYLTAGKVYRVLEYQRIGISAFFKIGCDEGFILNCCLTDCPHLNGQDWIIPEQLARKELPKPTISLDSPEFAKLTKDIVEHYVDIAAKEFQRRIDSGEIKMPEPSKPTTTYTSTSTIDIESLRNGLKLTKPPKNKLTEITDWGTLTKVLQTPGVAIIYSEDSDITVVVDKKCVNIKIEL